MLFAVKTHLDGTTYEQTIICGQLLAGHAGGGLSANEKEGKKALNDNNTRLHV